MDSETWDSAPVAQRGGSREERVMDEIPDGEYVGEIVEWSCFRSKSGDWMISWWIRVTDGLRKGAQLQRFSVVSDRTIGNIKADLRLVTGRIPVWDGDLVDADRGLSGPARREIVGAVVKVRQRTRTASGNTYVDVYLNELIASAKRHEQQEDHAEEDDLAEASRPDPWATTTEEHPAIQPSVAATETEAAGWGDPKCTTCHGAGCANCEDIPF